MNNDLIKKNNKDLTLHLANDLINVSKNGLSENDIIQVEHLVLDYLGVCLRGGTMPWSKSLKEWGSRTKGSGISPVFGGGYSTVPSIAALINATAAHGMELDDTHDTSVSHPGAVVISVAFAVGSTTGSSSRSIANAIALGYETIGRIGRATRADKIIEHGFHPTALFGGFAATSTAGLLLNLNAEKLTRAWGLMLSMAGGSMQFSEDPLGTTVKRLHAGYGAHNGILAAEFASLGIDGPSQAFDGRYGLCNIFGFEPLLEALTKNSDDELEIHKISMKPYPCCRLFHSTIDALREVTDDFSINPSEIKEIRVGGPSIMVSQHMMRRPNSVMAAQYSLPYTMGASIIYGPTEYSAYESCNLGNNNILKIADKVHAYNDKSLDEAFPEHFGSWVELDSIGNSTRRVEVLDSFGTPSNPMPESAIIQKLGSLITPLDTQLTAEEISHYLKHFFSNQHSPVLEFANCFTEEIN